MKPALGLYFRDISLLFLLGILSQSLWSETPSRAKDSLKHHKDEVAERIAVLNRRPAKERSALAFGIVGCVQNQLWLTRRDLAHFRAVSFVQGNRKRGVDFPRKSGHSVKLRTDIKFKGVTDEYEKKIRQAV